MGVCCGLTPKEDRGNVYALKSILKAEEITILEMIFKDLGQRTSDRKINLENFLLFFHKNGFWGQRLFKEFDFDETNLISKEEFIHGIARIFKSTEKDKISLLFKFFSKNNVESGVFFKEFLIMLYNYPKEDLKVILNDRDFIHFELKKSLIPIDYIKKDSTEQCIRMDSIYLKPLKKSTEETTPKTKKSLYQLDETVDEGNADEPAPSMIGKDIMKQMNKMYKPREMVISLKDGEVTYDIRTSNIHQLVKKFALRIFHEAGIDEKMGKLNFDQFYKWISVHKALYLNYYDGFHNQVWELEPQTGRPRYLSAVSEKTSEAIVYRNERPYTIFIYLLHSILVVRDQKQSHLPSEIICLEGLAVKRIDKLGFEISHRDGIYPTKKYFFATEKLLSEWLQLLQYYKGASVQQLYEIAQKIGTGKFSIVYKCRSTLDGKEFAIKVIETFKLEPEARALIAHESSIMKVVSHPLLLEFRECIQTKTHIYIVTELVKGKDLFEFVKDYRYLEETDAAVIMQQILVGVRYLHSFEIVHRDLKPENIMIVFDEEHQRISNIKIIDFGFANYLSVLCDKTAQERLAGTPNYIAPETLRQEATSFKVDNFALGAILYFMISGTLPFNDYDVREILRKTMSNEYSFKEKRWSSVSEEAKCLIQNLLKDKPEERISLQDALSHSWFKCIKDKNSLKALPHRRERTNSIVF